MDNFKERNDLMPELLKKDFTDKYDTGLSSQEAARRLKEGGANILKKPKRRSRLKIFVNQFHDVMTLILIAGAVISAFLGEIYDAYTILVIVFLNAFLGFFQEYKTEKTLQSLEKMTAPTAKVYRDKTLTTINAENMVEGDVFEIESGDRVPCDAYILSSKSLMCDESVLTGEAVPCEKKENLSDTEYDALNLSHIVYMGCIVTKGSARCKAVLTGERTQMGKVSQMLSEIDTEPTPLQRKLAELGKILAAICIGVCIVVTLAGILRGEPVFDMLMTGITIAIAAIPEGLPATVTIALALAVRRMLRKNALVHKLHSVETLGCASVICSDKTGTITQNKMTVTDVSTFDNRFCVEGTGYNTKGDFTRNGERIDARDFEDLKALLTGCAVCNNAKIKEKAISRNRGQMYDLEGCCIGDPTEIALLIAARKARITGNNIERIDEIPFDSQTKLMSVTVRENAECVTYIKGAPDVLVPMCNYYQSGIMYNELSQRGKGIILSRNEQYADNALRVLAVAKKVGDKTIFLGLVGMIDPPRKEAKRAIKICQQANIKTVMITGDHKTTACAIARQAGILKDDMKALSGNELAKMTDDELLSDIENIAVFARVNPSDKLRIVRAFRQKGHICAMTGDGVNDAPAIKEADIGVSMGISGTDVTKSSADVILLDDNFATLVDAVYQGRTIYSNIRKLVRYLISCNIGEVVTMFAGIVMGLPMVLLPTQILLVNLVTDGLPAIALGLEPCDQSVMLKKPRKSDDSFFSDSLLSKIIFRGIFIGLCTLMSFSLTLRLGVDVSVARTSALFTLVLSQLVHVFECKSEEKSIFRIPLFDNLWLVGAVLLSMCVLALTIFIPYLSVIFDTVPLSKIQLLISTLCAVAVPIVSAIFRPKNKKRRD